MKPIRLKPRLWKKILMFGIVMYLVTGIVLGQWVPWNWEGLTLISYSGTVSLFGVAVVVEAL